VTGLKGRVLGLLGLASLFLFSCLLPVCAYAQDDRVGIKDEVDIEVTRATRFPTTTVVASVTAVAVVVGGSVLLLRRQRKGRQ